MLEALLALVVAIVVIVALVPDVLYLALYPWHFFFYSRAAKKLVLSRRGYSNDALVKVGPCFGMVFRKKKEGLMWLFGLSRKTYRRVTVCGDDGTEDIYYVEITLPRLFGKAKIKIINRQPQDAKS